MGINGKRQCALGAALCALILTGCLPGIGLERGRGASSSGVQNPLIISGPGDETINLSGAHSSLSWINNDPLNIVIAGTWRECEWGLDGEAFIPAESGNKLSRKASDFSTGPHTITAKVTDAATDKTYTKRVVFTVELE
jgi:hypothetical protein